MASGRCTDVPGCPTAFLDVTSVTLVKFPQLILPFEAAFHAQMTERGVDGQPRTARRLTVYKNCPLPTLEDRLLCILVYLKTSAPPMHTCRSRLDYRALGYFTTRAQSLGRPRA